MSQPVLKTRDVVTIRQYVYRGINILVEIDRATKRISIVEPSGKDDKGTTKYVPKKWIFVDRTEKYVRTWVIIMEAMSKATQHALKEIEDLKDAEFDAMVKGIIEMGGNAKPTKRKDKKDDCPY